MELIKKLLNHGQAVVRIFTVTISLAAYDSIMNATPTDNFKKDKFNFISIEIWIALAFYYAIVIFQLDYIPIFDSLENLKLYLFIPRQSISINDLLFMHNGHPALGYFWPFWIGQWIAPYQVIVVHIINLLIGSLAVISFGKIVSIAFSGMTTKLEIALITIAFAIHPVFVAYAINMTPDYGVLAYFLASLWLLYSGRLGWIAITGTFLIFSKEIGLPSYILLVVLYLSGAIRKYRRTDLWPLAIPLFVFAIFYLYELANNHLIFSWMSKNAHLIDQNQWSIYFPNPFTTSVRMASLSAFIINFQWLFTFFILMGIFWSIFSVWTRRNSPFNIVSLCQKIYLLFRSFLFLLIGCFYIVSRIFPFTNQRYLLIIYPLILLVFFATMFQIGLKKRLRTILLITSIIILFLCNFRTLDPVSKKIAGTFLFGKHPILSISTIRPECCGYARDSMVYNLEHRNIADLLDMAFAKIRPSNQTTLVISSDSWYVMTQLDSKTYRRTLSRGPSMIEPIVMSPWEVGVTHDTDKPKTIFVILLPYLDNQWDIDALNICYQLKQRHRFTKDEYELDILEMILRP